MPRPSLGVLLPHSAYSFFHLMLSEIRSECQHNHAAHQPVAPVSVTTHAIPEVDGHVVDLDRLCLNGHKQKFITPCQEGLGDWRHIGNSGRSRFFKP